MECRREFKLETCNTCSARAVTETGQILCGIHFGELPTLSRLQCLLSSKTSVYFGQTVQTQRPQFRGCGYTQLYCEQF